jgi:hypothetical protein
LLDFDPNASVPREELLQLLRQRIADAVPEGRLIAEGILGAESRIDFVAVEPSGRLAIVVVGETGEELAAIGRALAHRAWVEARLPDWLQIAPELGANPLAGVCAHVLCPSFSADARAAAGALGESTLRLVRYHYVRNGSGLEILVEKPPLPSVMSQTRIRPGMTSPDPTRAQPAPAPPEPVFRTTLTDADLGLSGEERSEFE